ncbi:DUF3955 domain-containing protein [Burkholderia pseudomallei]
MIGIAKRDAGCRRYWTIYACFVVAGFACWLAFAVVGSEVDAQGILHEPFALLPAGGLLAGTGMVGGLIRGIIALYRQR